MVSRYTKLEENNEVVDVLYAIATGISSPKDITKKLKQKGSTIRTKLQFLKKNNVVRKDKWSYEANWDNIYRKMLNALNDVLNYYKSLAKNSSKESVTKLTHIKNNIEDYFPKEVLLGILRVYSAIYFQGYEKSSMRDMVQVFLNQLRNTEDSRINKINPKLLEVKKVLIGIPTKEELLFAKL